MPVPVAVIGAAGYTGAELVRLLLCHPHVRITGLFARQSAGSPLAEIFPQFHGLSDLSVEALDIERAASAAELAFLALPHGQSARVAAELRSRGVRVIDLSADFRLRDPDVYAAWYGTDSMPEHPAPALLAEAVYGLPERYRDDIARADLIACPGCYPTATILAIAPLLERGLVRAEGLVIDAKSGASGAGRTPALSTHFSEAGEGVRAYKVAGTHRHTGEIEQELARASGTHVRVIFTPHLVPMSRGILCCVYAMPTDPEHDPLAYRAALAKAYADEPFVSVLPADQLPDTAHVRGSNRAHVAVAHDHRAQRILAMSAIDNLVKGASGQAIQCMNIRYGWAERTGLGSAPMFP